jgi:hypothetical protein
MTDEQKRKVLEKVRKLLALAQSANEYEAEAAAERAQILLAEHNLEMSEVHATEGGIEMDDEFMTDSRPWRRQLGTMVAKLYFCGYYYTFKYKESARKCGYFRGDAHVFTGERHNIVVAKLMFQYLNETVERLARDAGNKTTSTQRAHFITSFRHACANRICYRLYNRYLEANKKGMPGSHGNTLPALANLYQIADQRVQQFWSSTILKEGDMKGSRSLTTDKYDHDGLAAGFKAGDSVGLDAQVGKDSNRLLDK